MPPALWAAGNRESINLIALRQTAAHNARWLRIFMFIFCPAAENEPKERAEGTEVPSGSLLGALKVSFGNTRIGGTVARIRHHVTCARRASVRSSLARRCEVHPLHWLTPWGLPKGIGVEGWRAPRVKCGGRYPIRIKF